MRHRKRTCKLGRNTSHRRCLFANMLKSLIDLGQIETTVAKAKELKRHADKMITLAKKNNLAARRLAKGKLMLSYNTLTPKEARAVKNGDKSPYNADRLTLGKLFDELAPKYQGRDGGYTRIIKLGSRVGDAAPKCIIEFI